GTTDAKIHSVTRHDDGVIEVAIDHWPKQPAEQHPDDAAVDRFAAAMKAKLKKKRQEGRERWQFMTAEQLSILLHEHVSKGDPVDVANLAMMLHQNGQVIKPPTTATLQDEIEALWEEVVALRRDRAMLLDKLN